MSSAYLPTLTKREDFWIRTVVIVLASIVGFSAAILSWSGLTYLALNSGYEGKIVLFLPIAIDGLILLGVVEILRSGMTGRSTIYGWTLNIIGGVLSIVGNIASSGEWGIQSQIVHSIPPIALFLSIEVLSRVIKNRITDSSVEAMEEQKEFERELKRQQLMEARAIKAKTSSSVPVSTDVAVPISPAKIKVAANSNGVVKRGSGSRVSMDDSEVATYKELMAALPEDDSKASKIEAVLLAHPEARNGHIALALGVEMKSVNTTIVRIRSRVQEQLVQADTFHEIVKDFEIVATGEVKAEN